MDQVVGRGRKGLVKGNNVRRGIMGRLDFLGIEFPNELWLWLMPAFHIDTSIM